MTRHKRHDEEEDSSDVIPPLPSEVEEKKSIEYTDEETAKFQPHAPAPQSPNTPAVGNAEYNEEQAEGNIPGA